MFLLFDNRHMGKRTGYVAMLLVALSLLLSGCAKFKQIRPVSAGIESVVPSGLRSVVVNVKAGIENPAPQITLSDINGSLERSGKVLGRVLVDPFILKAKTTEEYHLRVTVTLDQEASLFDVMALTRGNALDECTVDVYFKASLKGGISKKMSYEDIPLKSLMKI